MHLKQLTTLSVKQYHFPQVYLQEQKGCPQSFPHYSYTQCKTLLEGLASIHTEHGKLARCTAII